MENWIESCNGGNGIKDVSRIPRPNSCDGFRTIRRRRRNMIVPLFGAFVVYWVSPNACEATPTGSNDVGDRTHFSGRTGASSREGASDALLSESPSLLPSLAPSVIPSFVPSPQSVEQQQRSARPTQTPSHLPSAIPSSKPSRPPSLPPSFFSPSPSTMVKLVEHPSLAPSKSPNLEQSPLMPTIQPTWPPIRGPTVPTHPPSLLPTTSIPTTLLPSTSIPTTLLPSTSSPHITSRPTTSFPTTSSPSIQPSSSTPPVVVTASMEIHINPVPSQKMNQTTEFLLATATEQFLSEFLLSSSPPILNIGVLILAQEIHFRQRQRRTTNLTHEKEMGLSNGNKTITTTTLLHHRKLDSANTTSTSSSLSSQDDTTSLLFNSSNAIAFIVRGEFTPNPPSYLSATDVDLTSILEQLFRLESNSLIQILQTMEQTKNDNYFSQITTIQTASMLEEETNNPAMTNGDSSNEFPSDDGNTTNNNNNNNGGASSAMLISIGASAILVIICSVGVLCFRARQRTVSEGSKAGAFPKKKPINNTTVNNYYNNNSKPQQQQQQKHTTTNADESSTQQCLGYLTVDEERRDDASSLTYSRVLDNGQSFSFDDATAPAPEKPHFKSDELLGPMPGETYRDEEEEERTNEMFFDLSNADLKGNV